MILNLELQPMTVHNHALIFTWDSEAGVFEEPDGAYVAELADEYARLVTVTSHPYPTTYPCDDPRHNSAHLAAIFSIQWRLPAELAEALPRVPDSGQETGSGVVY